MKEKIKNTKGITLVALIITIIVLLILAVVAVTSISDSKIIKQAKIALKQDTEAQIKEQDMLEYYEATLSEKVGKWTQKGATLTKINTDGTKTQLKIGDYVAYDAGVFTHTPNVSKGAGTVFNDNLELETKQLETEISKWRVLGANDKGELELISEDPTNQKLCLANGVGYVNAEENLNNFCNDLYGKGKYATGARSLKVEDIDKLAKYDKTEYTGYGKKWLYKTTSSNKYLFYSKDDGGNWYSMNRSVLKLPDGTQEISTSKIGEIELNNTYYSYNISENITVDDGYTNEEISKILDTIIKGTSEYSVKHFLATKIVKCTSSDVEFNVGVLESKMVKGEYLWQCNANTACQEYYVRPVVMIENDVNLTGNGNKIGSKENMWQIEKK